MTPERAREIIETMLHDDDLIDFAITASRRDIRLAAEIELRRRYPSKKAVKKIMNRRAESGREGR